MGHTVWSGVLFGVLYSGCALGVLYLLTKFWHDRLLPLNSREMRDKLESAMQSITTTEQDLADKDNMIRSLEAEVEELNEQLRVREHPVAQKGKREIHEALLPEEEEEHQWIEEENAVTTSEVTTQYDALVLLQKCLVKAQNLSGAHHLGEKFQRYRDLSLDNFTIDLRRLFDILRNETSAAILVYSRDEQKFLFANDVVKGLFGWTSDHTIREFTSLIRGGLSEWEELRDTLEVGTPANLRLVIKAKAGSDVLVHSCWSVVPSGVFRGMLLGVLFR